MIRQLKRFGAVAGIAGLTVAVAPAANAAAASSPARGYLKVCNHAGYLFDVYADGPSFRVTDLAGSWDECETWRPRVGYYELGYNAGRSLNFDRQTVRIKRSGRVVYKRLGGDNVVHTYVAKGRTTRVDLGIPDLP